MRLLFNESSPGLKARLAGIYAVIAVLNIGAWLCALVAFRGRPVTLGIALMSYALGLRHAFDADHIAAIDNVTRNLMQRNKRPVSVGFFFALGHSAVVVVVVAVVVRAANALQHLESFRHIGRTIGVSVSALFLFAIAAMNIAIVPSVYKRYRRALSGSAYIPEDGDLPSHCGILTRIVQPLFGLVTQSWHMLPLGFLFGLGLDTATEVAMFAMSVAQAAQGISLWAILIFPLLFAAAMSLIDTTDGVVMLGAYEWAFVTPVRKLYYNMTITVLSVVVALSVGGIELLGLVAEELDLHGPIWRAILSLNEHLNNLGLVIVGLFLAGWLFFYLLYRIRPVEKCDSDA
jgi:nickel/cobalt transporter (NiCoT) family protein